MVSDEALKKLQEQIAAWPMTQRFVVQQLIRDYLRNREDLRAYEATGLASEEGGGVMERLTNKREADAQRKEYEIRISNGYPRNIPEERFLRLAAYEDTDREPEEVEMDHEAAEELHRLCQYCDLDRLEKLAEADKDGRLVVMPCKVGDIVWANLDGMRHPRKCVIEFVNIGSHVTTIVFSTVDGLREQYGVNPSSFGKTVFLTCEEAEKALEAIPNE